MDEKPENKTSFTIENIFSKLADNGVSEKKIEAASANARETVRLANELLPAVRAKIDEVLVDKNWKGNIVVLGKIVAEYAAASILINSRRSNLPTSTFESIISTGLTVAIRNTIREIIEVIDKEESEINEKT